MGYGTSAPWPSKDRPKLHAESTRPGVSYDFQEEVTRCPWRRHRLSDVSSDTSSLPRAPWFELIVAHEAIRVAQETRCGRSYPPLESGETLRGPTRTCTAQVCCQAVTEHIDSTSAHRIFHCAGRGGIWSPGVGRSLLED